jgi:hypothetical protein
LSRADGSASTEARFFVAADLRLQRAGALQPMRLHEHRGLRVAEVGEITGQDIV